MIDIEKIEAAALTAIDEMDDCARMDIGVDPIGPRKVITAAVLELIKQHKALEDENSRLKTTPAHKREDLHCVASDLAAQCREVEAERDELKRQLAECKADRDEFQSVITAIGVAATGYDFSGGLAEYVAKAFAEGAEYKADAERYRWLRTQHESTENEWHVRETTFKIPYQLDMHIDAAMKGATE